MSDFLSALQDQEQKADLGWSQSNLFSQDSQDIVTGNQMFTPNTPDSRSIGSLDGWSSGGVVVEEPVQDNLILTDNMSVSDYVFGSNSSQILQPFNDVDTGSQISSNGFIVADGSAVSDQLVTEPIAQDLGSLSEDKTFRTSDGRIVKPNTYVTSEGLYSTINLTVSADGMLTPAPASTDTDNSNVTDGNNSYLSQNSSHSYQVSHSVLNTGSNTATVLAPNTTVSMTMNHLTLGNGQTQATISPSPTKSSNVILIPKVSPGQQTKMVTLDNETVQAFVKGSKQMFSGGQKYTYINASHGSNPVQILAQNSPANKQVVKDQGEVHVLHEQVGTPKLTSLLKQSLQYQPMKLPTAPQKTVDTSIQQCSQTAVNSASQINRNLLPITVKLNEAYQHKNQTIRCNNANFKVISPAKQPVNNRIYIQDGKNYIPLQTSNSNYSVGDQNSVGTCTTASGQSQTVGSVQTQYLTTLTTNDAGMLVKNLVNVSGNSNILSGSSTQSILNAINSGSKGTQANATTSVPQNVTYIIGANAAKTNQSTYTYSRGRVPGSRARGRGRGIPSSQQQYIIVSKGSLSTAPVIPASPSKAVCLSSSPDVIDLISSSSVKTVASPGISDISAGTQEKKLNGTTAENDMCINKKFVKCKDGGELVAGTTYLVSGPNGLQKKMLFNGENFVEPVGPLSSPEVASDGSMIGGGRKEKPLKGNAIGLNMARENNTSTSSQTLLPNGRPWKYTDPPDLTRPPLHTNQLKVSESESPSQTESSSQSTDASIGAEKEPDDFSKEYVAICKFCGFKSSNLTKCVRCNRLFPTDIKLQSVIDGYKPLIEKGKFYSKKMSEQASVYGGYTVKHVSEDKIFTTGRTMRNLGKQFKLVHTRKKTIPQEPVTVTISSDEDEPENEKCDNKPEQNTQNSKQEVTPQNTEPDELSELVSVIPLKRAVSPTFKGGRIAKMENKEGQPVRKVRRKNSGDGMTPIRTVSTTTAVIDTKSNTSEIVEDGDGTEMLSNLTVDCRSIRVGSLKGTPVEPVFISGERVEFNMEGEDDFHSIQITSDDIIQCLFGRRPNVIFLHTTVEAGDKIREKLNMREKLPDKPYFEPGGPEDKHLYVTFFLNETCKVSSNQLQKVLQSYKHCKKTDFFVELDDQNLQRLLLRTAPIISHKTAEVAAREAGRDMISEQQNGSRTETPEPTEQERSPSSPRILFSGPVEKLITFPPPPATGGITVTNEDLFCLTDGEFLNDVIIDFYLKYLVHEKLSETDRKRTHVFSSFFFKRLTQRINRSTLDPNEAELSLPERRHARVKKWTKHVDLFKKDFIIVPINERSHWFLAIICFPGLTHQQEVRYICKESINEDSKVEKEEKGDKKEEKQSQEPKPENEEKTEAVNVIKEEEPMDEDEEEQVDNEEPMDTCSNSGSDLQEPRGRLLTEEDLKDPEIASKAISGVRQPCILVMDSLAGQSRQRIINSLKDYLQVEWNCKKCKTGSIRERFKGASPKVPQQTNYSDCGVYVLQYVDSFFEDPIFNFTFPMKSLVNWFTEERVSKKRVDIKELVMRLKEKYDSEKQQKKS